MSTAIEWTDVTWNPTTGCDRVSPGCDHCYALTLAARLKGMGSAKYQNDGNPRTSGPGFGVTTHEATLAAPLRWREPRMVFVNSMSDLFHKDVPDEFIGSVFDVMARAPQHTYQILTKRHGRMRSLLNRWADDGWMWRRSDMMWCGPLRDPLPNVWLGVSVEDQKGAELRIPVLRDTPAAVRFLSCEPLLGPIDLLGKAGVGCEETGPAITHEGVSQRTDYGTGVEYDCDHQVGVDWVICGGESGPGARPMHPDWVRSLRDQCVSAGVPFHFKQWGGRTPKSGGRELDGRTWDEFPAVAS
jgi:protein gp37